MVTSKEQYTRRLLEQARLRGQLVDFSEEAAQVGLECRCEMSEHLYRCLFWKYPSAGEHDVARVSSLLKGLQSQLTSPSQPGKRYYYVRPKPPTWWLNYQYFFTLRVTYRGPRLESVVILARQDSLDSLVSRIPRTVPATLLVRLLMSIGRLWTLSYRSERILLRSLSTAVTELLERTPFHDYARLYVQLKRPWLVPVPDQFSREEYRELCLRSLLRQLEVTAAVADQLGATMSLTVNQVLQLMANYVGLVPPSEDVAMPGDKVSFH